MTEIRVPRLNANDDEVEVLATVVPSGGRAAAGQHIGDVGTTKTAVQIDAPADGFVHWRHDVGALVRVGDVLADLTDSPEAPARMASSAPAAVVQGAGRRLIKKKSAPREGVEPVAIDRVKRDEIQIVSQTASVPTSSVTVLAARSDEPATLGPIVAAVAAALPRHPLLSAYFDEGALWRHTRIDLGVAMDLGRGLRVVTLRGADAADAAALDGRLRDAGERYLDDRLTADDLSSPALTITDLRMFGVARFEPILGNRQGAILGVSGGRAAGTPLTLTLVFDHRVLAGREAAMFLHDVIDALPAPSVVDPLDTPVMVASDERATTDPAVTTPAPVGWPAGAVAAPDRCDRCWISAADYYRGNPRDAMLTLYVRPDGSVGALCHTCADGLQ